MDTCGFEVWWLKNIKNLPSSDQIHADLRLGGLEMLKICLHPIGYMQILMIFDLKYEILLPFIHCKISSIDISLYDFDILKWYKGIY